MTMVGSSPPPTTGSGGSVLACFLKNIYKCFLLLGVSLIFIIFFKCFYYYFLISYSFYGWFVSTLQMVIFSSKKRIMLLVFQIFFKL